MRFSVEDLVNLCVDEGLPLNSIELEPSYLRYSYWAKIHGKSRIQVGKVTYQVTSVPDEDGFQKHSYEKVNPHAKEPT